MLVALAAALTAMFYAVQIPIQVAFCARAGEKAGAALGVRPFAGNLALRAARKRLGKARRRKRGKKPPLKLIWAIARRLLPHVRLEQVSVRGEVGLRDAAATAIFAGAAAALTRAIGAAAGARVTVRVQPDFQGERLRGEVFGIISLRVGHIMLAACGGILENSGRHRHGKTHH